MYEFPCCECDAPLEAGAEARGRELECESCGKVNIVLSPEDIALQIEQERERAYQRSLLSFQRQRSERASGLRSLLAFSDLLLLAAYVMAILIVIAGAGPALLGLGSTSIQLLIFVVSGLLSLLIFLLCRVLSTSLLALAELLGSQLDLAEQTQEILTWLHDRTGTGDLQRPARPMFQDESS